MKGLPCEEKMRFWLLHEMIGGKNRKNYTEKIGVQIRCFGDNTLLGIIWQISSRHLAVLSKGALRLYDVKLFT